MENIKQNMQKAFEQNEFLVNLMVIFTVLFLAISLIIYISNEISKKESNCKRINEEYKNSTSIANINYESEDYLNYYLNEYYVLSAYNCCCSGNNKNDYVDLCALENCIKQGARFLDFQIYNKLGRSIVASSSVQSFKYKETYNFLETDEVLDTVINKAFSSGSCSNYTDPLILYFRMFTDEVNVYNDLAEKITENLSPRLLSSMNYSNESDGNNILNKKLKTFKERIIIMIHVDNEDVYNKSKLKQYVNIASGPRKPFIQKMNSFSVITNQDLDGIKNYNRLNATIVVPNLSTNNINYDPSIPIKTGCQFICMNMQNKDNYLKYLLKMFNGSNTAFLIKPDSLRPIIVEIPESQRISRENCTIGGCIKYKVGDKIRHVPHDKCGHLNVG